MSDQPADPSGVVYLTVRRDVGTFARNRQIKPVKVNASYPRTLDAGEVVIRLRLSVPPSLFEAIEGGEVIVTQSAESPYTVEEL